MRYSKVCLGLWPQFSTLIGQLGHVPLFGARPWRYIRSWLFSSAFTVLWRALTASGRENRGESSSFSGFFGPQNRIRALRPCATSECIQATQFHLFQTSFATTMATTTNLSKLPPRRHVAHANARATRIQRGTKGGTKAPRRLHFTARTSTHSLTLACSWMVTSQLRFRVPEKTCVR